MALPPLLLATIAGLDLLDYRCVVLFGVLMSSIQALSDPARESILLGAATGRATPRSPRHSREVERAIHEVEAVLGGVRFPSRVPPRLAAIKLLERDVRLTSDLAAQAPALAGKVDAEAHRLEEQHGWTSDQVVCGERHTVHAHHIPRRLLLFSGTLIIVSHNFVNDRLRIPCSEGTLSLLLIGPSTPRTSGETTGCRAKKTHAPTIYP